MRRGIGVAGLRSVQARQSALGAVGEDLQAAQLESTRAQLESLRGALSDFAKKHRGRINSDHKFRQAFCEMCLSAGVDPLASSKGLWEEFLGVGHFYNELAVQVLTACLSTRDVNGGLLDLGECLALVRRWRGAGQSVDLQDLERAVGCLGALGKGVVIRPCGDRCIVCSVPDALSSDPTQALEVAAAAGGRVSVRDLTEKLAWPQPRAEAALAHFVRWGLCWVDAQDEAEPQVCWFPSIALALG